MRAGLHVDSVMTTISAVHPGATSGSEPDIFISLLNASAIVTLQVTTARVDPDIVILRLAGRMSIGSETCDLEWLLRDLLRQGERKLIFDLVGVDQIDADAALFLVRCFFATRGFGGELRFAGASAHVARPFRTTMLDTLLPFDPTVTAACEHFKRRSAAAGG